MGLDVQLLRESFALVVEREPQITHRFYEVLFEKYPASRSLFKHNKGVEQEKMLRDMLVAVMEHLEDAPWLSSQLGALGAKHTGYGVTPDMYQWVGGALLATLRDITGSDWTPALETAWSDAYAAIAGLMQAGAEAETKT